MTFKVALYDKGCRYVRTIEATAGEGYSGTVLFARKRYLVTGRVADTLIATESLT